MSPILNIDDVRLPSRFWAMVIPEPNSGCWLWLGSLNNRGYGEFAVGHGDVQYAHRVALSTVEPLVPGLVVDHRCETSCCVNPGHLHQVTDARNRQLTAERKVFCDAGHTWADNAALRFNRRRQRWERYCAACHRAKIAQQRQARRLLRLPRYYHPVAKACEVCGVTFPPYKKTTRTCSPKCGNELRSRTHLSRRKKTP